MTDSKHEAVISLPKKIHILPRIVVFGLSLIFRYCPLQAVLLIITTVVAGLLPAVQVYISKLFLDTLVIVFQTRQISTELPRMITVLSLQFAVFLAGTLINQLAGYVNFSLGRKLSFFMNQDIIQRAINLDFAVFDAPNFQDIMARAQQESAGRPLSLLNQFKSAIQGIITFLSMSGIMLAFGWSLFVVSLISSLPLLLIQLKYGQLDYQLQYDRTEEQRRSSYYSAILTSKYTRPEICSYEMQNFLFSRWLSAIKKFLNQDLSLRRRQTFAQTGVNILLVFFNMGVVIYIVYVGLSKHSGLTVGDIIMFSGSFAGGLNGFRAVISGFAGIYQDSLFLSNLIQFYEATQSLEVACGNREVPEILESIEFDNITFTYPGGHRPALKNVNVRFKRGCSTLLVGSNGAGKTTLLKLLMRLYEPDEGKILINGHDIREYNIHSLRKSIGIIFQYFQSYAFTAGENIGCGYVEKVSDENRIVAAAKRAKADEFIEELPYKYDTPLTRTFANGQDLSGGQWQRICLARLFMKDAPAIIFDEPTASLDIETEAAILEEIQATISAKKLCILISHRMFRPGIADHIVVLSQGEVLEQGTYDNLVDSNGEFARLRELFYATSAKVVAA